MGGDIGSLGHDVCERDAGDDTFFALRDLLQNVGDLDILVRGWDQNCAPSLDARCASVLKLPLPKGTPRDQTHAFGTTHGK